MRTIAATETTRTVPADHVHLEYQPGDVLGGVLTWQRPIDGAGRNEIRLALTVGGYAVFAEEVGDAWAAVAENGGSLAAGDEWALMVEVAGVRQ